MVKFVMEKLRGQHTFITYDEDAFSNPNGSISTPRRIHLSHPRENESERSRLIPSQGG